MTFDALLLVCLCLFELCRQCRSTTYYLSQATGNDSNSGTDVSLAFATADTAVDALTAGDTLMIVGELTNPSYDPHYSFSNVNDSHLWHGENTLKLNGVEGTSEAWISIVGYNGSSVLKGDGANIVRLSNCAYIRLLDLSIVGEVLSIPYSTAKALQFVYKGDNDTDVQYRVNASLSDDEIANLTLELIGSVTRPSYTDTRGMYVSNSHHINIEGNVIANIPGNGLRVSYSEYVDIIDNEVVNASRKSYSGTHGLVVTYTSDALEQENAENYRARVLRNVVHHNYNEIYSWVGTKTFIHTVIDEGKGISLERNEAFTKGGRILIANNVAYWNGYSGVNNHDGDNVDFVANTAYMNSYTNSITYANASKAGNNAGISFNGGENGSIINNIAVIDTSWSGWQGYPLSVSSDFAGELTISSNVIYGMGGNTLTQDSDVTSVSQNTIEGDPQFAAYLSYTDANIYASYGNPFQINKTSPAFGSADYAYLPCQDFLGNIRSNYTIGAIDVNTSNVVSSPFDTAGDYNMTLYIDWIDDCYDWLNVTESKADTITVTLVAVADGYIRYREEDFRGQLTNLDVKNAGSSSDLRETHIRFDIPSYQYIENLTESTDCNIDEFDFGSVSQISLFVKSMGYDVEASDSIDFYLAFSDWNETQNSTDNVPSINDTVAMVASIPTDLRSDEWDRIELNQTLVCQKVQGLCANYSQSQATESGIAPESFEIMITASFDSRVLQFYSRESGANNTAYIEMVIDCSDADSPTTTAVSGTVDTSTTGAATATAATRTTTTTTTRMTTMLASSSGSTSEAGDESQALLIAVNPQVGCLSLLLVFFICVSN